MKDNLRRIGDVFMVEQRLKEIDPGYEIYYNLIKKRYEVHNAASRGDSLVLVCPYDAVDSRLIGLVRKTRVERADALFREMEEENERIAKRKTQDEADEIKAKAKARLEEMKKKLTN